MARDDESVVIEGHELLLNRIDDFGKRATPEIGSADTLHKQGVACEQNISITGQVKRCAARRVSRCVQDTHFNAAAGDGIAVLNEVVDCGGWRSGNPEPLRLNVQLFEKKKIRLVYRRGYAKALLQI